LSNSANAPIIGARSGHAAMPNDAQPAGAHTVEMLRGLDYSDAEIDDMRGKGIL
jgi:crotonobetainyl-CoA:carnitine CoA-transferase CaiB-like acyl-CoA transferase